MRSMEFSGRTVDEAIFVGLNEMGVTIDEVEIETLQDETKGLFGFGARQARVRLTERETPVSMDFQHIREEQPQREKKDRPQGRRGESRKNSNSRRKGHRDTRDAGRREPADRYQYDRDLVKEVPGSKFLADLLVKMGVHSALSAVKADGGYRICIETDTDGLLIGRRGETLDAIQYLTSLVANQGREDYVRITIDTEGYRSRREDTLRRLAKREAVHVLETGRPVALEAMNPYERRVLHCALQDMEGVVTYSEGEEPDRHVVIAPAETDA
ncbi:MAG: protein jag [Clostridia bacterium]|nr:protein jag [Clostridia bacterium]